MLPHGFSELVKLVISEWDWDDLPAKDSDIWEALLSTVFLGATVRSAQAGYVKDVLGDVLEFEAAGSVFSDPDWSNKALKTLNAELGSIGGTPGEGFKRAILLTVIRETERYDLSRTIGDALTFFTKNKVDIAKIKSLEKDTKGSMDFVAHAAASIHNVRYIKAVLWLYGCGIARKLVPPNAHVTRFLHDCGFPGFGWSKEPEDDKSIFAPVCSCMKKVAEMVESELKKSITPKQAQAAVWYLQTCRGLLPRGQKSQLTPHGLIDFLETQKWSIGMLGSMVGNVEELENLATELKAFLEYR